MEEIQWTCRSRQSPGPGMILSSRLGRCMAGHQNRVVAVARLPSMCFLSTKTVPVSVLTLALEMHHESKSRTNMPKAATLMDSI